MKAVFLPLILFLGIALAGMGHNDQAELRSLQNDLERLGPKKAVQKLRAGDPMRWESILDRIEGGNPEWLQVAEKFRSGTDAAATTELTFSVARALPKSPEVVLGLTRKNFAIGEVCTSPFIEPDLDVEKQYLLAAKGALEGMSSSELRREKQECLRIIEYLLGEVSAER